MYRSTLVALVVVCLICPPTLAHPFLFECCPAPCGCEPVVVVPCCDPHLIPASDPCCDSVAPAPKQGPPPAPTPPKAAGAPAAPAEQGPPPTPAEATPTPADTRYAPPEPRPTFENPPPTPAETAPAESAVPDSAATGESASRYPQPSDGPAESPATLEEAFTESDAAAAPPPSADSTPAAEQPAEEPSAPAEAAPSAEPAAPAKDADAESESVPDPSDLFGPGAALQRTLSQPGGWASDDLREWTDASGRVLVAARVVGIATDHVLLVAADHSERRLAFGELSAGDLSFLRGQIDARQAQLQQVQASERLAQAAE